MARLGAVRSHYCALLLAAALAVCAFYYLGSGRETFSSATKRLKEARAGAPAVPTPPAPEVARGSVAPAPGAKAKSLEGGGPGPVDYHLLMMFTKAEHNAALQAKARVALRSLLRLAKFEAHEVLNLHFVSEEASREVAKALLRELLPPAAGFKCKVSGAATVGSRRMAHPIRPSPLPPTLPQLCPKCGFARKLGVERGGGACPGARSTRRMQGSAAWCRLPTLTRSPPLSP